jgi:hypothetical protein
MRPLRRPMFRTGGPIKEGVMNGLKDGGPATYMADATMMAGGGMPNMRGRVTGPGGYAGKKKGGFRYRDLINPLKLVSTPTYLGIDQAIAALTPYSGLFANGGIASLPTKAALVGNPVYPKTNGREHHKNVLSIFGVGTKSTAAAKPGLIRSGIANIYDKAKNIYARRGTGFKPSLPKVAGTPGKDIVPYGTISGKVTQNVNRPLPKNIKDAFKYAGELALANPKTTALVAPILPGAALAKLPFGIADTAIESYLGAEPFGVKGGKEKYRGIKKSVSDFFKRDKEDDDDKVLTEEQKRIKALEQQIAALNKKNIIDKPEPTEEEKLNRIYKLLGVDRAKKNAASKALIDMSRYIDEGGKDVISKKNIASTISKGISAFDKRLDKVDQLKEAAGLMQAKAEIEAMSDPYSKEYKKQMAEKLRKENNPTARDYARAYIGKKTLSHPDTVTIGKSVDADAVVLADAKKAKEEGIGDTITAEEYVKKQIKEQGGDVAGVYIVDKVIIQVDAQGRTTQLLP